VIAESAQRRILITGAAGGLGQALTIRCSEAGWDCVLIDKDGQGLEKLADQIMRSGAKHPVLHPLDLAGLDPVQCDEMVNAIEQQLGGLDSVVHTAALFAGLQPSEHIKPAEWLKMMQVNLNAPWLLSMACLPLLRRSELPASLIFLTENLQAMKSAYWGPYGASKAALSTLIEQLHHELSNTSVMVLGFDPGPMRTSLRSSVYHTENPQTVRSPEFAADKILELISFEVVPDSCLIKL